MKILAKTSKICKVKKSYHFNNKLLYVTLNHEFRLHKNN